MAFGAFADANKATYKYIDSVVRVGAPAWRAHLGATDVAHAKGLLRARLIVELGVCAARAHARLVHTRLDRAVGPSGARGAATEAAPRCSTAGDADDGVSFYFRATPPGLGRSGALGLFPAAGP